MLVTVNVGGCQLICKTGAQCNFASWLSVGYLVVLFDSTHNEMRQKISDAATNAAINTETAPFLLSPRGRDAARELTAMDLHERQTLTLLQELRQHFEPAEAGALLALARLRQRAVTKFPAADQLFFTADALEQATAWPIATKRAAWFAEQSPPGPILDLGCGIGGDLLALAQQRSVIGVDRDPVRLQFAAANAAVLGVADRVQLLQAEWPAALAAGTLPAASAAFADPARRVGNKRIFSLQQIEPPLRDLLALQVAVPNLGVKVMPGVDERELPANCGVEFISHGGICKEAVLWFHTLARHERWASSHVAGKWHTLTADDEAPPVGPLGPKCYLHEPDPAVIRASALGRLCTLLDAHLFDPQIAYLVSPTRQSHPLAQSFQIDEVHPFRLKLLNRRLQALAIGQIELKKRGFPVAPEELRPRLKLVPNGRSGVVLFTRQGDQRLMLIGRRMS